MRRLLLLLILLSAAGAAAIKLRGRTTNRIALEAPSWPPIAPVDAPLIGTGRGSDDPIPHDDPPAPAWRPINPDGTMPDGYPVKANSQSMIFHVPTGRFYGRTKPERCYATEAAAEADGYRRSKS